MKSLMEADTSAQKRGTEESTVMRKKTARGAIFGFSILVALCIATIQFWEYTGEKEMRRTIAAVPTNVPAIVQGDCKQSCVLSVPAGGKSVSLTVPIGYKPQFTGSGFTSHCVYTDGSEGIIGDPVRPCHDGPIVYVYAQDTTGRANTILFEPIRDAEFFRARAQNRPS